jgi:hypothetical protein
MKMSKILILILSFLAVLSCKKESEVWLPEDHLLADSAIAVQELKIINQTTTAITFDLSMVRFNGKNSEETYSDLNLSFDNGYYANTILTETIVPATPSNQYSTVLLFQSTNTNFYEDNGMSNGLRRLFEIVDNDPNKNLAMTSRRKDENIITIHQSGSDPFANSATFNNNAFHELLQPLSYGGIDGTGEDFRDQILAAIALFDDCVSCSGQKSILIFDDEDRNYYADNLPTDDILAMATAANIQINVVCNYLTPSYADLALHTGGFMLTQREGSYVDYEPVYSTNSLAILVQSLDAFLTQSLTKHQYRFILTEALGADLESGFFHSVNFIYGRQRFEIVFRVP